MIRFTGFPGLKKFDYYKEQLKTKNTLFYEGVNLANKKYSNKHMKHLEHYTQMWLK